MSYNYQEEKKNIFTENGQEMFIKIRDKVKALLNEAKCFRMDAILSVSSGSTWTMMACVDRMVEMNEIYEVTKNMDVAGQHRIFSTHKQ